MLRSPPCRNVHLIGMRLILSPWFRDIRALLRSPSSAGIPFSIPNLEDSRVQEEALVLSAVLRIVWLGSKIPKRDGISDHWTVTLVYVLCNWTWTSRHAERTTILHRAHIHPTHLVRGSELLRFFRRSPESVSSRSICFGIRPLESLALHRSDYAFPH
ncbi:hypothetical protein BJ508DRAFT_117845 [Ascobolus immersus RN42]|uniref:Uncharacterized protein n=1 Tax=Ascobolus immersus RN42 TaxID=1160509 RepID=A0A3N4I9X8_ASCIM|nr:hypothetical protein BJ508DRAFT_117845 [Ascobolus immersus RN42]